MDSKPDQKLIATPSSAGVLQVYLLGTVDFEAALLLQKRLLYDVSGDRGQAALMLCEHPPLITVGRHGSRAQILFEPEDLRVRLANSLGQSRRRLHPSSSWTIGRVPDPAARSARLHGDRLSGVVRGSAAGSHGRISPVQTSSGFVGRDFLRTRMLASFGVAVRDWVSYFGAYVNVQPPLDPYRKVRPPARFGVEPMTSLDESAARPRSTVVGSRTAIEHCRRRFGFERIALFSEHPFLEKYLQPRTNPAAIHLKNT